MKVLVFEDNLMWSSRMMQTLKGLGYEPSLHVTMPADTGEAKIAIVNLASPKLDPATLITALKERGVHVIGHAGHKEKELMLLGRAAGCNTLATNGELTFKIQSILDSIAGN